MHTRASTTDNWFKPEPVFKVTNFKGLAFPALGPDFSQIDVNNTATSALTGIVSKEDIKCRQACTHWHIKVKIKEAHGLYYAPP